ncbi:zinc ribbon domain-containing protein [Halanaeroarchaeum sulfurireducens]
MSPDDTAVVFGATKQSTFSSYHLYSITQGWVYALIAIAIGHAIATVGLYVWLSNDDTGTPRADRRNGESGSTSARPEQRKDVVICPNCETPNEPGYRYCRQCVSPIGSDRRQNSATDGPDSFWIK